MLDKMLSAIGRSLEWTYLNVKSVKPTSLSRAKELTLVDTFQTLELVRLDQTYANES